MTEDDRKEFIRNESNLNSLTVLWSKELADRPIEWLAELAHELALGHAITVELPENWPYVRDLLAAQSLLKEVHRRFEVAALEAE